MRWLAPVLLSACSTSAPDPVVDARAPTITAAGEIDVADVAVEADPYAAAARATGVPAVLLAGLAQASTGQQMILSDPEIPGQEPRCGVLAMPVALAPAAAALAGVAPGRVCTDRAAHLLAGAHLLRAWADEAGIAVDEVGAWAPIIVRWAGLASMPDGASAFVHDAVYAAMRDGVRIEGAVLRDRAARPDFPAPRVVAGVDASGVVWRPSPNKNGRGGVPPELIVIHTCEGAYAGCWSWLTNSASGVSAHYVVNESGSEVSQLVAEADRAWHVSATYDCARNSSVLCNRTGTSSNTISIGIEHGGYGSQTSWAAGLIQRSAELVCDIADRQGIALDSYHVVAHGQLQPWNRTDPGAAWPWASYLSKARAACNATTPPTPTPAGQVIIDSNDAANTPGRTRVEVSSSWVSSAAVSGYWNTGYWYAQKEQVSDPARFWFKADGPVCYTVDAWWTAASDRAASATFVGWDPSEAEVGRATVDQRGQGSQWVPLGTWRFPAGWNQVVLSRWGSGGVVIADAVRLTPCASGGADADGDGVADADDLCPADPAKAAPGVCGCAVADTDTDGDGVADCDDVCPEVADPAQRDGDGDGIGDACDPSDTAWDPGDTGAATDSSAPPADTDTDGAGAGGTPTKPPGGSPSCRQGGGPTLPIGLVALGALALRRRRR